MPETEARVLAPTFPTRAVDADDRRAPGAAADERTGDPAVPVDPYAAYTGQAEDYDYGTPDLDGVLPVFAAGLLAVAGRLLATYRDALTLGDRPLSRRSATATATVFADLPAECDRQDRSWRLQWARCLDDLAADLQAGRAPLPRCTGERWALQVMTDRAPYLLACSDAQLAELGVHVPAAGDDYRPPYWEGVVEAFVVDGAEYSISQARPAGDGEDEDPAVPVGGWDAPAYWFEPYGITVGRDPDRGHPPWVVQRLDGAAAQPAGGFARAGELLGCPTRVDPWAAYTDEYRGVAEYRVLAEVLTPQAAALLVAAAQQLADIGYEEVISYGDEPLVREPDDDGGWYEHAAFLANLPPICDRQNQPWRLAMVRAVDDLAEDLRAGRAPLPRCNAEEVALHLILREARVLLDEADDVAYFAELGLPTRPAWSPRHRQFDLMREVFFQDEDVLMSYDAGMAEIVGDPEHLVTQMLHTGDLRPRSWFWTFSNVRPRPAARGFPDGVLAALRECSPALRFTTPAQRSGDDRCAASPLPALPEGLSGQFEVFVGLAQHRFFDRACAVAMARTLYDLLVAFIDTPALHPARVWMLGQRATVGHEMLIVDRDFCIEGHTTRWRLGADLTDGQARAWTLRVLTDCTAKVVTAYATASPELLLDLHDITPPTLDPALPAALHARAEHLATTTTLAGFLKHRRTTLGLTVPQLADAAVLPAPVIAGWEAGGPTAAPQLLRCASALQLPEDVLLRACEGVRTVGYWPLPPPASLTDA